MGSKSSFNLRVLISLVVFIVFMIINQMSLYRMAVKQMHTTKYILNMISNQTIQIRINDNLVLARNR